MTLYKPFMPTLDKLQTLDNVCFLWIQRKSNGKKLYPLIRTVSASGDGWLYALIVIGLVCFDYTRFATFFYCCLFAFCIDVPLYLYLKNQFKRNRPANYFNHFESKILPSDEFSFPSGHTAAASVMTTQVMIFFPALLPIVAIWAAAIGLSRILLGVHFPGDILAGGLLGITSSVLATQILSIV